MSDRFTYQVSFSFSLRKKKTFSLLCLEMYEIVTDKINDFYFMQLKQQ